VSDQPADLDSLSVPVERSSPPKPGRIQPYAFPSFSRHKLAAGLELIPVHLPGVPLVGIELLFPAGSSWDPDDRPGLASLVSGLLDEGTEARSALEIASSIERLGGRLGTGTDWNVSSITLRLLSRDLEEGLDLLAEVARRPTFPAEEVERARRNRLTDLMRRHDRPSTLAIDELYRAVYGDTTYGRPLVGTPESIRGLDRGDVEEFYRRHYRLGGAILLAVGDLDAEAIETAAVERFGAATLAEPSPRPALDAGFADRVRIRLIDRPGSPQTELRVGHPAVPRQHPDWTALGVLNGLFGGKFTSRINLNLRERHALTYGASSRFVPRLGRGPFVINAAVANDGVGLAVREILTELERLRQEPVGEEELAETKSYILGVFPYSLQTAEGILQHLENLAVFDLPDDYYVPEVFMARLAAVDREEVLRVAREHLHPDGASVVAVGPAAELRSQLEGIGELEVIEPEPFELKPSDVSEEPGTAGPIDTR